MQFEFFQDTDFSIQDICSYFLKEQFEFPVPLGSRTNLQGYALKLSQKGVIVLAHHDHEIRGAIAGYCNDHVNRAGYISVLVVSSKNRGQGLSSVLLTYFISKCVREGMKKIIVLTNAQNTAAIGLYKKFGFVQAMLNDANEYQMMKNLEDQT